MNSLMGRCLGIVLVTLAIAAPAMAGEPVTLEPGMDRMGGDYKSFPVRQADPAQCRQACADDSSCRAYTFVKPGIKGPAAVCFLKSAPGQATANACCTSGSKAAAAGRPGPIVIPPVPPGKDENAPPAPSGIIEAPSDLKASSDIEQSELTWHWGAQGCFPGAAGGAPAACQFIKDIQGFKLYNPAGKLLATIANPGARFTGLNKGWGDCFVLRAYKGSLQSASSAQACLDGGGASKYATSDAIPVPAKLRLTLSVPDCNAALGFGLICEAAIKANAQPLVWDWTGKDSDIDGFRIYDNAGSQPAGSVPIEVATKNNPKLRLFMVEPLKGGVAVTSWCFRVRAFKGQLESKASNAVCLKPLFAPPPPLPPAPTNVRLAKNAAECAAATGGGFMALICDGVFKSNGQALIWDWQGKAADIDGFRLYDTNGGQPFVVETKLNPAVRLHVIPALKGVKVSDWCFQVRAFSEEGESLPGNKVCVTPIPAPPPAPPPPNMQVFSPTDGDLVNGFQLHKNWDTFCPAKERYLAFRGVGQFGGAVSVVFIRKNHGEPCAKQLAVWYRGGVEFRLSDLPPTFAKATLKFTSGDSAAKMGGSKSMNAVNCVKELYAYNIGLVNNNGVAGYEKMGDPKAWFSYHKTASLATGVSTTPGAVNAYDVTAILKASMKAKQKKQGFAFDVQEQEEGNDDMCAASFNGFSLEVLLK
jgi:hypothetical protein